MSLSIYEVNIDGNSTDRAENKYGVWRVVLVSNNELICAFYGPCSFVAALSYASMITGNKSFDDMSQAQNFYKKLRSLHTTYQEAYDSVQERESGRGTCPFDENSIPYNAWHKAAADFEEKRLAEIAQITCEKNYSLE